MIAAHAAGADGLAGRVQQVKVGPNLYQGDVR